MLAQDRGFDVVSVWKMGMCAPDTISSLHPPGVDLTLFNSWLHPSMTLKSHQVVVAMHTDAACYQILGIKSINYLGDPPLASFATTWAEVPLAFSFSCEDWQCANMAWLPDPNEIRRYRMICPKGYYGKLLPYIFESRTATNHGYPVEDSLAATTKGYCFSKEHFKRMNLRGSGDCLQLDLSKLLIQPGDEILVWLEMNDVVWQGKIRHHTRNKRAEKNTQGLLQQFVVLLARQ